MKAEDSQLVDFINNKDKQVWICNHELISNLSSCSININMAESLVFDIADSLLRKIASYAFEEASRACGVYEDLLGIKDTLSIVRGFLLDAEEKKDQQHGLREWLRQIQNICSDAEDILFDEFELQIKRKSVVKASGSTRMKVHHYFSSSNPVVFRIRMARQIKDMRGRLYKVAADGTKFGLVRMNVDAGFPMQRRELTHSHVDASSVIGRENDKEEIIKLLMESNPQGNGDKSVCVIPIVGIGGLGKTTLAKLVFNDKRMDEVFQLKMWVCVSNDFDIRHIIIKIINSASAASAFDSASASALTVAHQENINHFDIEQLQSLLRRKLYGKKFLLVLDDIWNDDRVKWIGLTDLIKVGTAGSKIIATTRSNSTASMIGSVSSFVLKGLSIENCLSLFVKWAFKEGEEYKYPYLVEIGKDIVKKCAGVPLTVRTLGSCLFSKYDLCKWEFVRDSEIWNLEQKKNDILPALKLSYDQMPFYLRHCFAYISLYPKNHTFYGVEFIHLWVALGLVQSRNGNEKQEDIVREYIYELNSRSFLQDSKDFGYFCKFKVHDLVHDLAMYVAKEECIVVKSNTLSLPKRVKHLSIFEHVSICHSLFPKSRTVRTIIFPIKGVSLDSEILLNTWIARYKYMRNLDLRNSLFETLPNSIAKLEHLCVLILSNNCKIKRLPNSICKLLNLQVLLLTGCIELETLPKGLGKLISLRELCITTKQSVLPLNELARLNNLRRLGFHYCDNLKLLFSGEQQLSSLDTLAVKSCGSLESLPLYTFPKLQTLLIFDCKMLNLYSNNECLTQRLRLKHLYIGDFPKLLSLPGWIVGASNTLETLEINNFPNLEMFSECLTTMSHLKRLYIIDCPQLLSLISDMRRLTALDDLRIYGCPELYRKYQPQFGEYWPMISHIKHVFIGE